VAVPQQALQQILNLLLYNACRSSRQQKQVAVNVEAHEIPDPDTQTYDEPLRFVHIAISDSGEGIILTIRPACLIPNTRPTIRLFAAWVIRGQVWRWPIHWPKAMVDACG
jgi:hypothetical protein